MISVNLPTGGGLYAVVNKVIIGPFDDRSAYNYVGRSPIDFLNERRGPYHENTCYNLQVNADLTPINSVSEFVPHGTADSPDRVSFLTLDGYGSFATSGGAARGSVTQRVVLHRGAILKGKNVLGCLIYVDTNLGRDRIISVELHEHTYLRRAGNLLQFSYRKKSRNFTSNYPILTGGKLLHPASEIVPLVESLTSSNSWSTSTTASFACTDGHDVSPTDEAVMLVVMPYVHRILENRDIIPAKDFGELAQTAVLNFNATNVNMLEFVRDLRNPVALIPKLRNLRNIKKIAGTYLQVHYGILPTISDLRSLWESATRVKSNISREGFRVSSAGHSATDTVNGIDMDLSQHLKIAVDNDDVGLQRICATLDSIGFNPKMSNLWDLIPLSFAVDWFVDIGDYLERTEVIQRVSQFRIRYVVLSTKRTSTILLGPESGFSGHVQLVDYSRWVQGQCPLPSASLSAPLSVSSHWLEALALTIQRIK